MFSGRRAYPTIPVADLNRAKSWYEQKLGLKPAADTIAGAIYDLADGAGFTLYPAEQAGKAPNTLMCFNSTDVAADVAELKKRGVKFEDIDQGDLKTVNSIATMGNLSVAWFRDSENNILAVGNDPRA